MPVRRDSFAADERWMAERMIAAESVKDELVQVRQHIASLMQSRDPLLDACLKELSARQGKMLRPALVLLFSKLAGVTRPMHIRLASMVELIHTASLLHDDVIDQAALRRNQSTANVLWGNTAAVLLGDFLLSKAFSEMADDIPKEAVLLLGRAAESLCTGELKQNLLRGQMDVTEQQYLDIIEAKTAALFSCSCRLGTVDAGDKSQTEAAGAYGRHLGIAFQIMDDLTDMGITSQGQDKTLGTDFLQEKVTLPVLYWLAQSPQEKSSRIHELTRMSAEDLKVKLRDSGCFDRACLKAGEHSRSAIRQLAAFHACDAFEDLKALTEDIVKRPCCC